MLGFQFLATVVARLKGAKDANFLPRRGRRGGAGGSGGSSGSSSGGGVSSETAEAYFRAIAEAQARRKKKIGP